MPKTDISQQVTKEIDALIGASQRSVIALSVQAEALRERVAELEAALAARDKRIAEMDPQPKDEAEQEDDDARHA